ncbi:hypothetical protein [Caballeronia sp. LZ016]|uniref:hypothetical protein n=1 Tax=Caballeronia sp. LZ016 TaxID=3038554 RepID=UPI00285F8942|nr:hypothetical protein [Caballeronia sp. LZ016]MDR5739503.1 hypothetical protein [Caballeronia sp. LZ016]
MQVNTFRTGDKVMVVAKDEFYAYIDGWRGRVGSRDGLPDGYVRVECVDEGIDKQFFVPCDQVALLVGR